MYSSITDCFGSTKPDGDGHVCRPLAREGGVRGRDDPVHGHLAGVSDPEQKRKIIGREFVEVFRAEAKKLANARWLAHGDDLSGRGRVRRHQDQEGDHHQESSQCRWPARNFGPQAARAASELFRTRFASWAWRLACYTTWSIAIRSPAPGSACGFSATSGKSTPTCCAARTAIFTEELRTTLEPHSGKTWYELTSQAFAVFLPVKSVGVMGDGRTLRIRRGPACGETADFMTASLG